MLSGWNIRRPTGFALPQNFRASLSSTITTAGAVAESLALKSRPADARDAEIGRLKEKVGDLTMATELLEAKIERLETARPLARRRSRR